MENPSEGVRGFYEFCRERIRLIRENPEIEELLGEEVYTFEQAFWILVVSMSLCTWSDHAQYEIRLSEIFRVYLAIYREEIDRNMSLKDELCFLKVLKDRYDKANKILHEDEESKATLHLAFLALGENILEVGQNVNIITLIMAGQFILAGAVSISPVPFRLIEDI